MENTQKKTLSFYTTGEEYNNLLLDFFRSGLFFNFDRLLENLTYEQKKLAFNLRIQLTGDTRTEEGLICHFVDEPFTLSETLYYAIKTAINAVDYDYDFLDLEYIAKKSKDLQILLTYYTVDEIISICKWHILKDHGYYPSEFPEFENSINGVILKNGIFIECGYQDHINLFPLLFKLKLSDASCWTDSNEVLHISSGQLSGNLGYTLESGGRRGKQPTEEQLSTIWRLRTHIKGFYGSFDTNVLNAIRNYTVIQCDNGGKFGNLTFIKKYYPEIKLPFFSNNLIDFINSDKIFMRSSPKKSLPGLLNSKIISPSEHDFTKAKNFMQLEFEKYANLQNSNKLHWFFQEFIQGKNGVCHIRKTLNLMDEKYEFTYQLSSKQGAVVKGKITSEKLSVIQEKELKSIAEMLFHDLEKSLQIEFVANEKHIYIVQLRILENEFETAIGDSIPDDVLLIGKTFSKGNIVLNKEDILIIQEDADSKELIGKKALIVESNVEFSHILALAKSLKIPAIYGTGKTSLPDGELNFVAVTKTPYLHI